MYAVELPNKGHFGDNINSADLFFEEKFSYLGGSKCIVGIGTGTISHVLYREVCYTVSVFGRVHYRRFHCVHMHEQKYIPYSTYVMAR